MKTNLLNRKLLWLFALLLPITFTNCHRGAGAYSEETTTRGNIKIGVDESFQLLFDTEIYTFQALYQNAHITPIYKPELDILDAFMKDSVRLMVTSRLLTKDEEKYLTSRQIVPRTTKIAFDALALIINKDRVDTLIKYPMVKDIFKGTVKDWKQINPKSVPGDIQVVFDNQKSGNVRYFLDKFKLPNQLPKNCLAADNNNEVINYVEKHKNAIGIISVNWISDKNDSVSHVFLNKIHVVGVSSEFDTEGAAYYIPHQAYIADKSYPFIREVYMISRESFTGLGSGFISFVAHDVGQRIILKSKLVPATMPIRLVQVKKD
jgi:phosphate transport system substrate-binding protein